MSTSSISRFYTTHASEIGTLVLIASPRGLQHIGLLRDGESPDAYLARIVGEKAAQEIASLPGFFTTTTAAIDAYFTHGEALTLPVDLVGGTPLQRAVWLQLAKIPFGQTISYTDLATKVGFPRAVRAVASACGANPLPLVIPCHRVIAKDGTLGGFSLGGLDVKEKLLALEKPSPSSWAA